MKLSIRAMMFAAGVLWAAAILLVGLCNLAWPSYGSMFLDVIASVYPGFKHAGTFIDVIVGTLYALVDGAVAGLIFAALYNACACCRTGKAPAA